MLFPTQKRQRKRLNKREIWQRIPDDADKGLRKWIRTMREASKLVDSCMYRIGSPNRHLLCDYCNTVAEWAYWPMLGVYCNEHGEALMRMCDLSRFQFYRWPRRSKSWTNAEILEWERNSV